jgi:hypothetical protein
VQIDQMLMGYLMRKFVPWESGGTMGGCKSKFKMS